MLKGLPYKNRYCLSELIYIERLEFLENVFWSLIRSRSNDLESDVQVPLRFLIKPKLCPHLFDWSIIILGKTNFGSENDTSISFCAFSSIDCNSGISNIFDRESLSLQFFDLLLEESHHTFSVLGSGPKIAWQHVTKVCNTLFAANEPHSELLERNGTAAVKVNNFQALLKFFTWKIYTEVLYDILQFLDI